MNADGTGLLRLTRDAADDGAPHWSPDETKIVFSSNRDGRFALYELAARDDLAAFRLLEDAVTHQKVTAQHS